MNFSTEKTSDETGKWSVVLVDSELNIVEEVALYSNHLEIRGLSPNTLDSYCRDMGVFFSWLNKRNMKFYDVTKRDIISFMGNINNLVGNKKSKSPRTINKYLSTVSSFYNYYEGIGG